MKFRQAVFIGIIILIGIGLYFYVLDFPFVFDSITDIVNNPAIKVLTDLSRIWNADYSRLHFFTFFTYAANYYFSQNKVFGYHLVNLILHIAATCMFYFFLLSLFKSKFLAYRYNTKDKQNCSFFAALIFLAHPLQTQSVTYVWGRAELLSGFFGFLVLLLYVRGRLKRNIWFFILAFFLFIPALFSKGVLIVLPLLLLSIEIYFFNLNLSKIARIIKNTWHFLIVGLVGLFGMFTFLIRALRIEWIFINPPFSPKEYLSSQFNILLRYIRLLFIPIGQNIDHYAIPARSFLEPKVFLSFVGVVTIILTTILVFKKRRLMSFGIAWFFILLLPFSSIFVLSTLMTENRIYLPLAGFAVFIASIIIRHINRPKARYITVIIVILCLGFLTVRRNLVWHSPLSLMKDAVQKAPLNPRANFTLGTLYYQRGEIEKAFNLFNKAIRLNPDYAGPHNNIGLIYMDMGNYKKAEQAFKTALRKGSEVEARVNLAQFYMLQDEYEKAESILREIYRPRRTDSVYVALGNIYSHKGRPDKAIGYFEKAIDLNPHNTTALYNLANIYLREGNAQTAVQLYERALDINPDFVQVYINMGVSLYEVEDYEKAAQSFEKALKLGARTPAVYRNLANAYQALGEYEKAAEFHKKSLFEGY